MGRVGLPDVPTEGAYVLPLSLCPMSGRQCLQPGRCPAFVCLFYYSIGYYFVQCLTTAHMHVAYPLSSFRLTVLSTYLFISLLLQLYLSQAFLVHDLSSVTNNVSMYELFRRLYDQSPDTSSSVSRFGLLYPP